MHHQDPQWIQHVLKEDCWHGLDFSVWDQLMDWNSKALVKTLDTSGLTVSHIEKFITHWVHKKAVGLK